MAGRLCRLVASEIAVTTGYSGSWEAVSFISVRSDSTVAEAMLSWFTAGLIISFVMLSRPFSRPQTQSCALPP